MQGICIPDYNQYSRYRDAGGLGAARGNIPGVRAAPYQPLAESCMGMFMIPVVTEKAL
jgi:hypothetical protein